ncbi:MULTISPECIES: siroheme synthase CysG [unclassified Chelatococcus]|uniref:siroheme synthase CysG n=1 Tax=unclassified Chelatococcus TaxID=2638111 RepID=UPI001BCCA776|nr:MULTISPECIES: siroheme synthase CysG [unclassified Chelatococcus]MBS7699977.1 siroheme synthase CysG [Chelatococcus sp. YT9]MBX3558598.1 siroheme synthase CysG [Chelatococcus sp.]
MQVVSRRPNDAGPARIRPLSVLPVFLDLGGRRAVVAGGSDAAAWKAELLAAAGAQLDVYARDGELSEDMARVVGSSAAITYHARQWTPADLSGAHVALADLDAEAAFDFERAARNAGAACNVIDKPAFCHFQFGAIVNRSPVVIGISTSGASPILGQAIRRRIETLLPPSLARWAALARDMRDRVTGELIGSKRRRLFWERLAERAFGPAPGARTEADLHEAIAFGQTLSTTGHVSFVGAGPGDAEYLTLKAVRALQAADVILFDDLVSEEVLELARREAKRVLVGKRAGRPSCKQDEINAMMVALAKGGRRIVRLKSGDPMIFGRAGEEIAALEKHGISYDVVPGITAGLALAAFLGVSLTHRDHARSVRFVTGHSKHGGLPEDLDWRAIADPTATTIFYMGGRTAAPICERLTREGLSPLTPITVAASIGRARQVVKSGMLKDLPALSATLDAAEPILIGIGTVFQGHAAEDASVAKARYGRAS